MIIFVHYFCNFGSCPLWIHLSVFVCNSSIIEHLVRFVLSQSHVMFLSRPALFPVLFCFHVSVIVSALAMETQGSVQRVF